MNIMIEVGDGFAIQREHVAVVRKSGDGKNSVVFTSGQSAVDGGFLVKQKYEDLMGQIHAPETDVMEAAQRLLEVLDQSAPYLQVMAEVAASAGKPYEGANFAEEVEDLRIALKQAE